MKITVTGGSGFLGSHVADELSKIGHKVKIFGSDFPTTKIALAESWGEIP